MPVLLALFAYWSRLLSRPIDTRLKLRRAGARWQFMTTSRYTRVAARIAPEREDAARWCRPSIRTPVSGDLLFAHEQGCRSAEASAARRC